MSTTDNNNNNKPVRNIITPFSEPSSSRDEGPSGIITTPLSDNRDVIRTGERTETTITPKKHEEGPTIRYVKHQHTDPAQIQAQDEARFDWHVRQAMDQLRGKRVDVIGSQSEELSPGGLQDVIAEAKRRLEQERKASATEREARQLEIQRRIEAGKINCPDCGQYAGNEELNPYTLENHQKKCPAHARRIQKEQELRDEINRNKSTYDRVFRSIADAMGSISDVRHDIHNLEFQIAQARYEKNNEPLLIAVDKMRQEWQTKDPSYRKRKIQTCYDMKRAIDAIIEWYESWDKSKEEADSEPVFVAGE
jgi:hypothetical protein